MLAIRETVNSQQRSIDFDRNKKQLRSGSVLHCVLTHQKEADRPVLTHKAGPRPSTFDRKDDNHGYR
jgi:hypothetical protein